MKCPYCKEKEGNDVCTADYYTWKDLLWFWFFIICASLIGYGIGLNWELLLAEL